MNEEYFDENIMTDFAEEYFNDEMRNKYFVNEKFKIIDREYTLHRSEQIASTHNNII